MSEHTPTPGPWEAVPCKQPGCWCAIVQTKGAKDDEMDKAVACSGCLRKADAELIVRCVNAVPALVDALHGARERLLNLTHYPDTKIDGTWFNEIDAALKGAMGEKS